MKKSAIAKISREVAGQFPEMSGVRPVVRKHGDETAEGSYLITYKGKAELPGGRKISRVVRVVADERGRILKLSTSK